MNVAGVPENKKKILLFWNYKTIELSSALKTRRLISFLNIKFSRLSFLCIFLIVSKFHAFIFA